MATVMAGKTGMVGEVVEEGRVAGSWLSPAAAAASLGISERTLWRHQREGKLSKRIVSGRAEVFVPGDLSGAPDEKVTSMTLARGAEEQAKLALALVEELRRREDEARASLERQGERVEALALELGRVTAERDALVLKIAARRWWNPQTW